MESLSDRRNNIPYAQQEHNAWASMCYEMRTMLKMTSEQFNKDEMVRYVIETIEQWGYWEHQRRLADPQNDKKEGLFWNGKKIV
jgi:hypothetical protein